jgi:hypothetical protein
MGTGCDRRYPEVNAETTRKRSWRTVQRLVKNGDAAAIALAAAAVNKLCSKICRTCERWVVRPIRLLPEVEDEVVADKKERVGYATDDQPTDFAEWESLKSAPVGEGSTKNDRVTLMGVKDEPSVGSSNGHSRVSRPTAS